MALNNWIYNLIVIKFKGVKYASFPIIKGRILLSNDGHILIGKEVKFICSSEYNFVGIYKTCSIAVIENAHLEIGDYSGFSGVSIYCSNKITIGKHVNCGGNVSIWDTDFHPLISANRRSHDITKIKSLPIKIGDDVFIGANSIILKGVEVGDRSVIGAGSVVTKDIPEDQIWAGNPAKYIKTIMPDLEDNRCA